MQKPLGVDYSQAQLIVDLCREANLTLAVNQNMRYDQSIRPAKRAQPRLARRPVLATIDMRAIPHWMPWQQRQGWVTLRIMSIHHLDAFRFLFGDPVRVFASIRPDPRTAEVRARRRHLPLHPGIRQRPALHVVGRRLGGPGPGRVRTGDRHPLARRRDRRPRPRHHRLARLPAPTPSTLDFTRRPTARLLAFDRAGKKSGFPTPSRHHGRALCALEENRGADDQRTRQPQDDGPRRCLLFVRQIAPRGVTAGNHARDVRIEQQ